MGRKNIRLVRIIAVLVLFLLVLNAAFLPAFAWTSDTNLTNFVGAWDTGACVFQGPQGKVWVTWASDRFNFQDDIYYKTSSNGGNTWSRLGLLTSNASQDSMPSAIVLKNGTMLLVWASDRMGNYDLFYKTSNNNGLNWSNETQLTNSTSRDNAPSVVQDIEGDIWVVWQRQITPSQFGIFYKIYNGTMWLDETAFIVDSYSNASPAITMALNGSLWVVWSRFVGGGNYDIFYKISNDNGATWLDRPPLTTDTNWDITPSITMSKDGKIWVVWSTDRPNGTLLCLYYKTSTDYGLTWTDDTLLVSSNGDDANPSITSDDEGRVWVVWESTRSDFDVYYKVFYHDLAPAIWGSVLFPSPHAHEEKRTWVFENNTLYLDINITNFGFEIERYFNVTVYFDSILLEERPIVDPVYPNGTITYEGKYGFMFNTTGLPPGDYQISVSIDPVFGEIDILDNVITSTIRIRRTGDANGDGLITVADAVETQIALEVYNSRADYNIDGEINVLDCLLLSSAFAKQ